MLQANLPLTAFMCLGLLATGCASSPSGSGGSGSGGSGTSTPSVTLSATSLSFTGTDSGYPTAAQTIKLTNSGTASLTLGTEQLSGADYTFFSGVGGGVGGCANITLAPAASCTSQVEFTPVAVRSYSATLTFTDNASNSPQSVALSGTLAAPAAPTAAARYAYAVGTSGLYSFSISSAGVWTPIGSPVGVGDTIGAMVIDPLDKFLFIAGFTTGDPIVYNINQTTGALSYNGSALASNNNNRPEGIAIDPTGTFLYVSNTGIGTVDEYTVNRSTGALTFGGSITTPLYPNLQPGVQKPTALITDPAGKYLYVGVSGYIAQYNINATTGALTPQATPTVDGTACDNLHLDSTGKYLYCVPGISIYSINSSSGGLNYVTEPGYPVATGQDARDIGLTFNSTFAYVTNTTDETISLYSDNASTGDLAPLNPGTFTLHGNPFQILVDPGNQFAYIVTGLGDIELMQINPDGTLSLFNTVTVGSSAAALQIYPTHP